MLKKSAGMIFSVIFLAGAFLNAAAQEATFTAEDLTALSKNASDKLKGKTYRVTTDATSYENGSSTPTRTQRIIREIIPPDREHYISETETADGVKRYESISIKEKLYFRENNGEWQESKVYGEGSGIGGGRGTGAGEMKVETTVERKLKKGEFVNNQTADYYETVTTTKFIYPTATYTTVWRTGYWFNADGMFVKTFNEYETNGKISSRSTRVYEYDANIKIEAPVVKSKPKP